MMFHMPPHHERTGGDPGSKASRGQVMIMFAIYSTAMFAILGLAVDLGMSFAERRSMQNAADLGAIAGARAIARYTESVKTKAWADVEEVVAGNGMQNTPWIEECYYRDKNGVNVGPCTSTVPETAIGIQVTVAERHPTYFLRIFPWAPENVVTRATALAEVERIYLAGTDSPFIICGYDTKVQGGGTQSILLNDNTVNPAAVNQTFVVHNSQIEGCGVSGWKGLAENREHKANNDGKDLNVMWNARTGDQAGPTRAKVEGVDGCAKGTDISSMSCVMLIPVASNSAHGHPPVGTGSQRQLYVVKMLAFKIGSCGANCHTAKLLDDYIAWGKSDRDTWSRDTGGVVVVKLRG